MKGKDKGGGDGGTGAAQNLLSDKPEGGILQGLQQASDHVPEHQQLWLASSTLLFLFSCIGAMYTYIIVNPGLIAYYFEETNCTVADSFYKEDVSCLVTDFFDRGCISKMKCVEIIVKTYPNYGTDEYYRLRPNEYSYSQMFLDAVITQKVAHVIQQ